MNEERTVATSQDVARIVKSITDSRKITSVNELINFLETDLKTYSLPKR